MSVHGGNIEEVARMYKFNPEEIVDFSANINPMGLSENVKKAMINSIDKVIKYPDITYFDLKNSISIFYCCIGLEKAYSIQYRRI